MVGKLDQELLQVNEEVNQQKEARFVQEESDVAKNYSSTQNIHQKSKIREVFNENKGKDFTGRGIEKALLINHDQLPFKLISFQDGLFYGDTDRQLLQADYGESPEY